jgi:hypothetical protein
VAGGGLSGGSSASFHTVFEQTSNIVDVVMYTYVNASKTHTRASPGQLWVIPAGVIRRAGSSTHFDTIKYWPFNIQLDCMTGATPPMGCNNSLDERDLFADTLIARMVRGNAAGVATAMASIYSYASIADVVEGGSIGSMYFNEGYNSAEDGTSITGIMMWCGSQNQSTWYGGYFTGQSGSTCMGYDENGNSAIGYPMLPYPVTGPLLLGTTYAGFSPNISTYSGQGYISGTWRINGNYGVHILANNAAAVGDTTILLNTQPSLKAGLLVTDETHPAAIPDNTTITVTGYGYVTLSNPVAAPGVAANDSLTFSGAVNCMMLNPGIPPSQNPGILFDSTCQFSGGQNGIQYNGSNDTWNLYFNGEGALSALTLYPKTFISLGYCYNGSQDGKRVSISDGLAFTAPGGGYGAWVGTSNSGGGGAPGGGSTLRNIFCSGAGGWVYD